MKLPLDSRLAIDLAGKTYTLDGRQLSLCEDMTQISGPLIVLSDLKTSQYKIETVSAKKRYAAAILERELRERGDVDGPCKVHLVDAKATSNQTECLYTSVEAEVFADYWQILDKRSDHCLIVPFLALLFRYLSAKKGNRALLFQYGHKVVLLGVSDAKPVICLQVNSTGDERSDWSRPLTFLANEIQNSDAKFDEVEWHSWDPEGRFSSLELDQMLSEQLDVPVVKAPESDVLYENGEFKSSLPSILKNIKASDAIADASGGVLFGAERFVPWAAAIALGVSLALFFQAQQWQSERTENLERYSMLKQQIDHNRFSSMQRQIAEEPDSLVAALGKPNVDLLNRVAASVERPSLPEIIVNIRQSVPDSLQVYGLRLDSFSPEIQFTIEGNAGKDLQTANQSLALMSSSLRKQGYTVRDNGMLLKDGNNLFQIVVSLEGGHDEV
ncbi:hypothetical protein [Neptuniibacter sp.]|uniref:hypothetical protein n=1 Tax=Neptuniibacter sp. TaxID=1962643 RepID=UPI00260CAB02|nr:hypothetical protein [Neptuniibacter sp.]MCP4595126.1 hypothetical protein [Neptuniibacter sp.]